MALSDFFKRQKEDVKEDSVDLLDAALNEPIKYIPNKDSTLEEEELNKEIEDLIEIEKAMKEINNSNISSEEVLQIENNETKEKNILDEVNEYIKKIEKENLDLKEKCKKLEERSDYIFGEECRIIDINLGLNYINDCRKELVKTNKKLYKLEMLLKEI
ncbi:hypothetical protein [Aliarcobacter butzleri]|uniref:hypothetical protein n=1 Tax=Aliarcobacter butzleri TaxID=28197 RepID=UPI0021B3B51F|nr:hypothetical protein [Aliarcobacter butzleri]MCT7639120.1 hypothetical protein [Aliarcobacter butzleri]